MHAVCMNHSHGVDVEQCNITTKVGPLPFRFTANWVNIVTRCNWFNEHTGRWKRAPDEPYMITIATAHASFCLAILPCPQSSATFAVFVASTTHRWHFHELVWRGDGGRQLVLTDRVDSDF